MGVVVVVVVEMVKQPLLVLPCHLVVVFQAAQIKYPQNRKWREGKSA